MSVNTAIMKDILIGSVLLIVGVFMIDFMWTTFDIGVASDSIFNTTTYPDAFNAQSSITTLYGAGVGIFTLILIVRNLLGGKSKSGGLLGGM